MPGIGHCRVDVDVARTLRRQPGIPVRRCFDVDAVPAVIVEQLRDGILDRAVRARIDIKGVLVPDPTQCPKKHDVFAPATPSDRGGSGSGALDGRQLSYW
jgi:hypothetical protein